MNDRKSFVAQNSLAHLQTRQRNIRIDPANIIGSADANMRLVRLDRHMKVPRETPANEASR